MSRARVTRPAIELALFSHVKQMKLKAQEPIKGKFMISFCDVELNGVVNGNLRKQKSLRSHRESRGWSFNFSSFSVTKTKETNQNNVNIGEKVKSLSIKSLDIYGNTTTEFIRFKMEA